LTEAALTVSGISKSFPRYRREFDRILNWFGLRIAPRDEAWVLRDISFSVPRGQALGVVGRNGAGKSTLLKVITGTSRPTTGHVEVHGRVAAILELGMGFNFEFTGRQNTYHAASMMGVSQAAIEGAMADIEAFAELGNYFDQPLRIYSSGMQVRLAFAIATAFRPDILIIDEALSVGDAYFQHKSFERIRSFREQGTTLFLVSHDKAALQSICDRAILLDHGQIVRDGDPESVLDYYNALMGEKDGNETIEVKSHESGRVQTSSGTGRARIESVNLFNAEGEPVDTIGVGTLVELRVRVRTHEAIPRLVLGYALRNRLGQTLYGTNTHYSGQALEDLDADETLQFAIRFPASLGPGTYSVTLALSATETHLSENYEWRDLALIFTVLNFGQPFDGGMFIPAEIIVSRR
jgi:lipopolysaccharide transport system ATP-binding protein